MIVLGRGNFIINTVGDGLQGYRFEPRRERMASERIGESEVSLDTGVDLAQAVASVGGWLALPTHAT